MQENWSGLSKKSLMIIGVVTLATMFCGGVYFSLFAAPKPNGANVERFIITNKDNQMSVTDRLKSGGFIKSTWVFGFVGGAISPGGYKISKSMNVWEIAGALAKDPYMRWVVIPEGLRKEEIADLLFKNLDWSIEQKIAWLKITKEKSDYAEGVYFPDTYLIGKDETPNEVANRLRDRFEEVFTPYSKEAIKQNIKWTTVIKLASIIQREAAGNSDMALIAGILWNRLDKSMPLQADATLQYARGETSSGWWGPITLADKKINSPYNTYLNKGLPPTPISNPGLEAIKSVLSPAKTDCLYYLHDKSKIIHCAKTYDEHLENIVIYLN